MRFFIVLILSFVLYPSLYSKDEYNRNDSSDVTIITFDNSTNVPVKKNKKGKIVRHFPKNNVKIGVFGAAYGEVPFYYERYFADWFTLQAGVGITFRDFLGDVYSRIEFGSKSKYNGSTTTWVGLNEYPYNESFPSYQNRKSSVGVSFSLAPRFFVAGEAFEGFYISPIFEYAVRNYKANKIDIDGNFLSNSKQKENTKSIKFMLNFGTQYDFQPITLDWSFGFGIVSNNYTRLDIGYVYDDRGNTIYGNRTVNYKRLNPYFKLNLDLGFEFGGKKKKK